MKYHEIKDLIETREIVTEEIIDIQDSFINNYSENQKYESYFIEMENKNQRADCAAKISVLKKIKEDINEKIYNKRHELTKKNKEEHESD